MPSSVVRRAQKRLLAESEAEKAKKKPRFSDEPKVKRELLKAREYKVWKFSKTQMFCFKISVASHLNPI